MRLTIALFCLVSRIVYLSLGDNIAWRLQALVLLVAFSEAAPSSPSETREAAEAHSVSRRSPRVSYFASQRHRRFNRFNRRRKLPNPLITRMVKKMMLSRTRNN